jgi:hypothetical protein
VQRSRREEDFRKRPRVPAARSGDFGLLEADALIAADSLEVKKESLQCQQAADDVIRRAQGKVGVGCVWVDGQ